MSQWNSWGRGQELWRKQGPAQQLALDRTRVPLSSLLTGYLILHGHTLSSGISRCGPLRALLLLRHINTFIILKETRASGQNSKNKTLTSWSESFLNSTVFLAQAPEAGKCPKALLQPFPTYTEGCFIFCPPPLFLFSLASPELGRPTYPPYSLPPLRSEIFIPHTQECATPSPSKDSGHLGADEALAQIRTSASPLSGTNWNLQESMSEFNETAQLVLRRQR